MDAQGEVQNFIIESYAGKSTIKNFHSEKSFLGKFSDFSVAELKLFFISTIGPTLSIPLIRLAFGASLLWGAYLVKIHGMGASSLIFFSGFLFLILDIKGYNLNLLRTAQQVERSSTRQPSWRRQGLIIILILVLKSQYRI